MRLSLRFMGLDLIDLSIETDAAEVENDGLGDCTSYPVGFTPPAEYEVPDRSLE